MNAARGALPLVALLLVAACGTPPRLDEPESPRPAAQSPAPARGGAYYKDDGPGDAPLPDPATLADAVPRDEPLHRYANRPYEVFGRRYVPIAARQPYRERGRASWYGRRFHGQRTSSGEPYDMYGMTAAHPTLPIPSYVRVTHLANGRSVVVRVNDRGPFHAGRIIDLSYAAAHKLGYVEAGSAEVEVEAVFPGDAPPVQTAAASPTAPSAVYLQVGAFSQRENAESFRERLAREAAWLREAVTVLASGALWRLHVGPYRSADEARSIAERIEAELRVKPLLVVR